MTQTLSNDPTNSDFRPTFVKRKMFPSTSATFLNLVHSRCIEDRRHTFCSESQDSYSELQSRHSVTFPIQLQNHKLKKNSAQYPQCHHQEGAVFVRVLEPNCKATWVRGQPAKIEWEVVDPKVQRVQILIMELGSKATTLVTGGISNSGQYTYNKVPWGMESGSNYYLRFTSVDDPKRIYTTKCFEITSAP